MFEWAEKLLTLQELDMRLATLEKQVAEVPARQQAADADFTHEMQELEQAKRVLREHEAAVKRIEAEIAICQEKKRSFQSKSALIKNNEEYRGALLQIDACDSVVKALENDEIEQMFAVDAAKAVVDEKNRAAAAARQRVEAVKAELGAGRLVWEEESVRLRPLREEALARVELEALREYQRIRQDRTDVKSRPCVVPVEEDGCCARCQMRMTPHLVQEIKRGKLICCPSCNALLYDAR